MIGKRREHASMDETVLLAVARLNRERRIARADLETVERNAQVRHECCAVENLAHDLLMQWIEFRHGNEYYTKRCSALAGSSGRIATIGARPVRCILNDFTKG